jgi:ketosteroid isomerase-like protein
VDDAVRTANLDIVRAFVTEGLAEGDPAAFDRYIAEDVWVVTGLKPGGPIESRDEYRDVVFATLGRALDFATAKLEIREALVTVDGRVLIRFLAYADHVNEVDGVPGTGRRLTMAELHLFCVRDGQIVENYVGGLNPLMWQMIYRESIADAVLPPLVQ